MQENIFNLFVLGLEMKRREAMLQDSESGRGWESKYTIQAKRLAEWQSKVKMEAWKF